jgi:hypothetical protein
MGRIVVLACVGILCFCSAAAAGSNPGVKVAVHVMTKESRTCTTNFPVITGCGDIVTTAPGFSYDPDVFPVFMDLVEYKLLEYAMTWSDGTGIVFHSCSDDAVVDNTVAFYWKISQSYNDCQSSAIVIPGWFELELEDGLVCIVEHPTPGTINIGDCQDPMRYDHPPHTFCAGTGQAIGDDPCDPVSTEERTWSKIKAVFK